MQKIFEEGRNLFEKFRGEGSGNRGGKRASGEQSDLDQAFMKFSKCCNEQSVQGKAPF